MKKFLIPLCLYLLSNISLAQFQISAGANTIDFDSFTGAGFSPTPSAGQLDSDEWAITGFSIGDLAFGGTETADDYARGTSPGNVGTGGIYAFDIGGGDDVLGIQPGGSDFTPGDLTLRIQNNTGSQVQELIISYDIFYNNDQARSNSLNFSHSPDNSSYTAESTLDFSTPEASDAMSWQSVSRNVTITGLSLADGAFFYLRWEGNDVSGSLARDEYGLNDISITPTLDSDAPPRFGNSTPSITGVTAVDFDLTTQLDEVGTSFFVVVTDGSTAPSSAQVIAGNDFTDSPAIVSGSISNSSENLDFSNLDISGFMDDSDYDVYVVAQDDEGTPNVQASPLQFDLSIPELEKMAITEFMFDTNASPESFGEWIELFNYGSSSIDINGWTLTDDGSDNATLASSSTIIPSGAYIILTNNKTEFQNIWTGGSPNSNVLSLSSGSFQLANTADEIIISNADGKEVWRLAYDAVDNTTGRATFFSYTDNANSRDYGDSADPGVVRNGNDDNGNLGYEGNDFTTDPQATTMSSDVGSPLTGNYDTPLPVELLDFRGLVNGNQCRLSWSTASELNNHGFYVEKSVNGCDFESISFIVGSRNSNSLKEYAFTDRQFLKTTYYRLKQEDFDGTTTTSSSIIMLVPQLSGLKFYPNPFQNQINISGISDQQLIKYTLINPEGKAVNEAVKKSVLTKKLEHLAPGIYQLMVEHQHFTIVKQ